MDVWDGECLNCEFFLYAEVVSVNTMHHNFIMENMDISFALRN